MHRVLLGWFKPVDPGGLVRNVRDYLENPAVYFSHTVFVETKCFSCDGFCQVHPVKVGILTGRRKLSAANSHLFSGELSDLQFNETSLNKAKFLSPFKVLCRVFWGVFCFFFPKVNMLTVSWPQTSIYKCLYKPGVYFVCIILSSTSLDI